MSKIRFVLVLSSVILCSINAQSQAQVEDVRQLSLYDVIDLAQTQSPSAKVAETRKKNAYWQYRTFRSNYNPRLNISGNIPGYDRDFFSNRQDDGQIVFQERQQLSSALELGLLQPISLTGGDISVNTSVNQFNDINSDLTRYNTTLFNIRLNQPILGFNDLKWDKRTEPLRYEESKRSFVESMEQVSQQATNLFFDYLDAQINLQIAQFNLANNDTIYNIEEGRYNIGTTSKDKLLQVELQLLRSEQDVTSARLDMQTTRLSLRRYIGMQDTSTYTLELILPEELPDFDVVYETAIKYAKQNRSDYIEFERRRTEANAEVARARASRFNANLTASFGLNNAAPIFPDTYVDPNNQQRVNLQLSMPILDWGRTKSRVQQAMANQELEQYLVNQDIQTFEQEILTLVSRFEVLRAQVATSKKSNEVAQERYEVAQNRYLIGKIDITNLNIALDEKDAARRSYIGALRGFWDAFFQLRRLTLYDFANNELLYQDEEE